MKTIPELVKITKEHVGARPAAKEQVGTVRVDLTHVEQKTLKAVYKTEEKEFEFLLDEPGVRGGLGRGPTPLGFFIAGAGG